MAVWQMAREEETVEGWRFICEGRLCVAPGCGCWQAGRRRGRRKKNPGGLVAAFGEEEEKFQTGGGGGSSVEKMGRSLGRRLEKKIETRRGGGALWLDRFMVFFFV